MVQRDIPAFALKVSLWCIDRQLILCILCCLVAYLFGLTRGKINDHILSIPSPSDNPQPSFNWGLYFDWHPHSWTYTWNTLVPNFSQFSPLSRANKSCWIDFTFGNLSVVIEVQKHWQQKKVDTLLLFLSPGCNQCHIVFLAYLPRLCDQLQKWPSITILLKKEKSTI